VSNNGSRSNINLIYSTGTSAPTSNVSTTKNKNPSYNSKKSIETALNELEDLLIDNQNFIKQHSKSNITNDSNQSIAKQVTTNNNNTSATKDNGNDAK